MRWKTKGKRRNEGEEGKTGSLHHNGYTVSPPVSFPSLVLKGTFVSSRCPALLPPGLVALVVAAVSSLRAR